MVLAYPILGQAESRFVWTAIILWDIVVLDTAGDGSQHLAAIGTWTMQLLLISLPQMEQLREEQLGGEVGLYQSFPLTISDDFARVIASTYRWRSPLGTSLSTTTAPMH